MIFYFYCRFKIKSFHNVIFGCLLKKMERQLGRDCNLLIKLKFKFAKIKWRFYNVKNERGYLMNDGFIFCNPWSEGQD